MAPIIHTVNLRKVYAVGKERVVALNDVSISIEKGEFCCIVGQSGSGKSTLLNQLAGLEKPTRGKVFIGSHEISAMTEDELAKFRQAHLGFIFQSYNLAAHHDGGRKRCSAADVQGHFPLPAPCHGPQRVKKHGPWRPCRTHAHRDERAASSSAWASPAPLSASRA